MPTTDQYITNESGYMSPYDITIDDLGFEFWGNDPIKGKFNPGDSTAPEDNGETPLLFNDLSNGMGMGYSGVPNTYAFSIDGYARTTRKFMPGGLLTEIDLTELGIDLEGEIRCALEYEGQYGPATMYVGAGTAIVSLGTGIGDPVYEYEIGAQIDSALLYNSVAIFSTDQLDPNWQYLTAYDIGASLWTTANWDSTPPDISNPHTYLVRTGADNYTPYARPNYLEKMIKLFQEVDGVGGYRILGNDSLFTYVQTQSDSMDEIIGDTDLYSLSLACGDSSYPITGILASNRIPFILKADGVYGIESSGIYCPNYVPDLASTPSIYTGVSGTFFNGKIFVGTAEGLLLVDVSNKQRQDIPMYVSPSYYLANETPVFGIPTAQETDNGWLVVALWNGTDSHICYTRPREATLATIPNPMIWHGSECTIEGQRITMLKKTGAPGYPIMLIGTHDGDVMHLYWLSLPREGDPYTDYLHGGSHQFARSCKLYLPFQDADDPNAKKVIRRFDLQADGLSFPFFATVADPDNGISIGDLLGTTRAGEIIFYANANSGSRIFFEEGEPDDPGSEWDFQGTITDSPKGTMIPSTGITSGYQIGLLMDCTLLNQAEDPDNDDPVYSPFAVRSIKVRTDVQVEQLEEKTYTVKIGDYNKTKHGRDHNTAFIKWTALTALQDQDAVYMINEWNERLLVKVEPGMQFRISREGTSKGYSVITDIKVTFLGRQFYYDIGQTFDTIYSWGL